MSLQLTQFAATEAADETILQGLGIDFTLLILQGIAFLLAVFVLAKWVYPVFMRIIDERETKIEESLEAAREASDNAANAQEKIDKQLATARKEARDIVATAKDEANALLAKADAKSKTNADNMIKSAQDEIAKETEAAKKALHNETIELVALATEKVVAHKVDAKADKALIKTSLEEVSQ